ncbi:MAG: bestrophin family protein [Nannocystaceae bacterium]|nr:hypothetical protein [bacterium]
MVSSRGSVLRLLAWQWKNTLLFITAASIVVLLHDVLGVTWLTLPTVPVAVIGGAIGIFVSFRTNSAYDRWWEGRKLWGRMINTSRHWGSQVLAYLPKDEGKPSQTQTKLVRRHEAYVHALRCLLRAHDPFEDPDFERTLPDDAAGLRHESNLTHALLARQLEELTALHDAGSFDAFRLSDFDESLRHLLDIQGGCERIKKTPMPRGYGFIAERLILAFSFLFPLSIVDALAWGAVPIGLVVCIAFALISEAGRVLEDPFTMFYNGLPLSQISRMIEANLEDRLGTPKADQVEQVQVNDLGILM